MRLQTFSDYPVHIKRCLWIRMENMWKFGALLFLGRSAAASLRLNINSMHSLAQARKKFVRNRSRHLRDMLRTKRVAIVRSIEQNFGADAGIRDVSEINLHLVHADAAHDGSCAAFYQYLSGAGKSPGHAIVISKGHDADFCWA